MSSDKMEKWVFIELNRLYKQCFTTWMTKVLDLAIDYNLDIKQYKHHFKYDCKVLETGDIKTTKIGWYHQQMPLVL